MGRASGEGRASSPGLAVLEDLARVALPELVHTTRQTDPAEPEPSPEDGAGTDARGPAIPVLDLSVEHGDRRIVANACLAVAAVTAVVGVTYADPAPLTIGLTLLVAVLAVVRRAWTPAADVTVTLAGSRLVVATEDGGHTVDLTSLPRPVDVVGRPGERRWRALLPRHEEEPCVVDGTMVDADEFMRMLYEHRAEVCYLPS